MRHSVRSMLGYSLIEALVAVLVMAFGALSFVAWQARLLINTELSRQRLEAVHIAHGDIEAVRAGGRSGAPRGVSTTTFTSGTYTVTRQVRDGAVSGSLDLQVTVSWFNRSGIGQRVVLHSIVSSRDADRVASDL